VDISPHTKKFIKEINAGSTSLILLSVLDQAREPLYGYQIARMIAAGPGIEPEMKQSALYPVLRSLEKNGLLNSRVEPSVSGPPRKYYSITGEGQEALAEWIRIWTAMADRVEQQLKGGKYE
jgi:PadR family transcriptional regulator, regulatory protein PadR